MDEVGVYRAVDADVVGKAVADAADVAGDALSQAVLAAARHLVDPLRLRDKASAHADEIGHAVVYQLLGKLRSSDVAHCDDGLSECLFHLLRISGAPAVLKVHEVELILYGAVEREGYVVDVNVLVPVFEYLQCILEGVAAGDHIVRGDADAYGEVFPDTSANLLKHEPSHAGAVLDAAAEFIIALVVYRGCELAYEIGMSAVDFHGVKACRDRACRRVAEAFDGVHDLVLGHRPRDGTAGLVGFAGSAQALHAGALGDCPRAGVVYLKGGTCAVGMDALDETAKAGDVAILVDADLRRAVQSLLVHTCVFNDYKPRAALGALLIVADVVVGDIAELPAHVAAHGEHRDAVLHGHTLHSQRRENRRIFHISFLLRYQEMSYI